MRWACVLPMMFGILLGAAIPLAALETEVLFDGTRVSDWDPARDQARLDKEYSLAEIVPLSDPPSLLWRFVSKGVAFNDIFLRKETVRPFTCFRVRVKNEGMPVTLAAKVRDARGAEWTANRIKLEAGEDWRWVEFPVEAWQVASWSNDPDGKLDFPLEYFTLIAFDVKPDVEYGLRVARVQAQRPEPPVATVHKLEFPSRVQAGKTYEAALEFAMSGPCVQDGAELMLRWGKTTVSTVPLQLETPLTHVSPGQRLRVQGVRVPIPLYAFGGRCSLVLRLADAHIHKNGELVDEEVAPVNVEARKPGNTTAQVKLHNGAPTLFINGEPHNGMAYTAYGPSVEVFSDFTRAGVDLYSFSATPTEAGYGLSRTSWVAPDEYDFSQLDERVLMVLEANPDAYIFPRLYVHAPKWWSEQNPDDIVLMDPGSGSYEPFIHSGGKPAPSWASDKWRHDTVTGLRRLIAHVDASPYADRIIGYHIASGTTEEWMMWGANENQWVGYSPVNVARFRDWLRDRYGSDEALRQAWSAPGVSFDTAQIPTKADRQKVEYGSLRDPDKEQAVIDFYLYNSHMVADTICYLAKAVKEITHGEKAVGVFYGYLLQLCGEQRQQNAGHLALAGVLESPDVDFLCSPTSYAFRQVGGEGTSHFMSLLGSIRLHGKLWFDENDIRTSLAPGEVGAWGKPGDVEGDILQQDKELANVLVNGVAQWWFDVGANRYDTPRLMQRIGELTRNASETINLDRTPAEQMAMVVDEKSLCYLRVGDPLGRHLLVSQLPAMHRAGAPVGHYLVGDLPNITDRKVFFMMTGFAPTAQDRRNIDALKRDGNVLVFCYTPGLYSEGQIDEAAMARLTGIKLKVSEAAAPLRVTMTQGHPIIEGLQGQQYGASQETWPVCYADDPQATVLGTLADGKAGLTVRQYDDWTAVHSAAPMLPARLIRRIAARAGVHLYIDTEDVVWAARELLAVSVNAAGPRTVRLPRQAKVTDLYTGKVIADGVTSFEAEFGSKATRIFAVQ